MSIKSNKVMAGTMTAGTLALFATIMSSSPTLPSDSDKAATAAPLHATMSAPSACDGDVWPYQTGSCISAIMEENGHTKQVRVISLYGPLKQTGSPQVAEYFDAPVSGNLTNPES